MALLKTMHLPKSKNYLLKGPVKNQFLTRPLVLLSHGAGKDYQR